jgi:hypothetical protein
LTYGNTKPHLDDSDSDASNESRWSGKARQKNPTAYLEPAVELDLAPNWNMDNIIAPLDEAYHTNDRHPKLQPNYIRPQQDIADPPSSSDTTTVLPISVNVDQSSLTVHPLPGSETGTIKATTRLLQQSRGALNPPSTTIRVHVDGGANCSITNTKDYLLSFCNIKKYPMSGVATGESALGCTGVGYLPWQSNSSVVVLVKCYFSHAADTVISPTDIVVNNITDYNAWSQYSNVDTGNGYITLHFRDDCAPLIFHLKSMNGLWYHCYAHDVTDYPSWSIRHLNGPVIHRLTKAA